MDQLHTGGAPATLALIKKLSIKETWTILDAGCGIGGSSRMLVEQTGCKVWGIDLSHDFIETAKALTQWCGLKAPPIPPGLRTESPL